jgi:flagellar basal body-associated protein FliL
MNRTALAIVLVAAFALPAGLTTAQPKAPPAKAQAKQAQKKQSANRLPAHYGQVVDDTQRKVIYKIQADYKARIDALQAELDNLIAERDAQIRAVLSPQQAQALDTLVAQANAARAEKAAKRQASKRAEKQ